MLLIILLGQTQQLVFEQIDLWSGCRGHFTRLKSQYFSNVHSINSWLEGDDNNTKLFSNCKVAHTTNLFWPLPIRWVNTFGNLYMFYDWYYSNTKQILFFYFRSFTAIATRSFKIFYIQYHYILYVFSVRTVSKIIKRILQAFLLNLR